MLRFGALILLTLIYECRADLWTEIERVNDLSEFYRIVGLYSVAKAYMQDWRASLAIAAPVDDVFIRFPNLRSLTQSEVLSHIIDSPVNELLQGSKWQHPMLLRTSVTSGRMYVTQFEHNPGNFSYFINNGRVCNQYLSSWALVSQSQFLYKICSWIGHTGFKGTAFDFVRLTDPSFFYDRRYTNADLTLLRDIMLRIPDVSMVIFGGSAWNGYHTFFLPNNRAFERVVDKNLIDREIMLAHVTGAGRVYFTESWLYDFGTHWYPSLRFAVNVIEDNFRLMLSIRNLTDRKTGRWDLYAVSNVIERYGLFRRGAVWAKIVVPNVPVENGVVHVVDNVLGLVSNTIDQLILDCDKCTRLMTYINTIGQVVRAYFSAMGGLVTFFAPINEAFDRIPEEVERRLLRDRIWLEQAPSRLTEPGFWGFETYEYVVAGSLSSSRTVSGSVLKLHIVPAKDLTTDQIFNETIANTVDNLRQLYFIKGEWPKNNITYYVIGGGVRAAIYQEDVAAINGIVHYVDRVLGVPYDTIYQVLQNETGLQTSYRMISQMQLRYTLDPWEVLRAEQNFTFFVPTDEAWEKVSPLLRQKFMDGSAEKWRALQFVMKRHIIQGQALMLTDLRERTYVMMNDQRVMVQRRDRYFQLYWPYGNKVARLYEGGEIAGINGFMHRIDNVLVLDEDLEAAAAQVSSDSLLVLCLIVLLHYALP